MSDRMIEERPHEPGTPQQGSDSETATLLWCVLNSNIRCKPAWRVVLSVGRPNRRTARRRQAIPDSQGRQSPHGEQWRRASELPPDVFAALHKPSRAINPVTIVATVDPDGRPRTAPFGSLRAITPRLLRLACSSHHTYANLCRHGQASVAVLAPPDIAVSIRGHARVVKAQMEIARHLVVVEVDVEEAKNDMMQRGIIKGAEFTPPEDLQAFYLGAIAEIEDM